MDGGWGVVCRSWGFVPEAQNDMIYSIICEELGLFGALAFDLCVRASFVEALCHCHAQPGSFRELWSVPESWDIWQSR